MLLVLTSRVPIAPSNVVRGVYMTSYTMMIPFWSMAGTSLHDTLIAVEETVLACTLVGGESGTGSKRRNLCV